MNNQNNAKTKIPVDLTFDTSMLKIFVPAIMVTFILLALSFRCPACETLIPVIWYLSILAVLLQDRTTVEFTHGMIIIHRQFFGPLIVNQKNVTKTHIKKNTWHTCRWALYLLMMLFLGYLVYTAYNDIIQFWMPRIPEKVMIHYILSRLAVVFLFIVLFFMLRARLQCPAVLRVDTNDTKYVFYPDRPDELEKMITDNKMERD